MAGPAQTTATAQAADPGHAAILDEDGLKQQATATYTSSSGNTATVRAFRFGDATGAYAAFTAYREPGMRPAEVGPASASRLENAAADAQRALFWSGATLVDVSFKRADLAALHDLTALAAALPPAMGSAAIPPPVAGYLPLDGLVPGSVRYAIGPAAYAASGAQVPAEVIDFSRDAEVISGTYRLRGGEDRLTLVMYPTPQMAGNREQALAKVKGSLGPGYTEKRLGPMLAYATGTLPKEEADRLLGKIRYKFEVVLNQPQGYVSEVAKAAKLLLGIGYLTAILGIAAVLLAVFLGAGRVLIRRLRGKPISSMNDEDFISLKIDV